MRLWKFYCVLCEQDVEEPANEGHAGSMKRGVCLACSKAAVMNMGRMSAPLWENPVAEVMVEAGSGVCACGCGKPTTAGRLYSWGHKNGGTGKRAAKVQHVDPSPSLVGTVVTKAVIDDAIAMLRTKRDKLNDAIAALESL